jgi:predicted nucleotidyltransferase
LANADRGIELLWLYGSQANGSASKSSDYDFAVAFSHLLDDPLNRRLHPELLVIDWQSVIGLPEKTLSIVDINQAPLPLASSIISSDSKVLVNKNNLRYTRELNRIWGLWSDSQWRPSPLAAD